MSFTLLPERQTPYTNIKYNGKLYINYGDFHCHTVFSLHGLSSPTEVVDMAMKRGLSFIGVGDHFYHYHMPEMTTDRFDNVYQVDPEESKRISPYQYRSQKDFYMIRNQIARVHELQEMNKWSIGLLNAPIIVPMYEYNFFTDVLKEERVDEPHLRIIGLHDWFANLEDITGNELVSEIDQTLHANVGVFSIFAHPERELTRIKDWWMMEENKVADIVWLIDTYGMIMEVNTRTIQRGNVDDMRILKMMLAKGKILEVPVIVNSDAHHKWMVGNCGDGFKLLEAMEYPIELIVNFDYDRCKELAKGTA